ncbi:MAG: cation diffusion facilitator family transporter, partial [Ignavibacteriaceae bacterium]|nr:cation diffusion facilitator family transporter [Ignavibacteriaceae bacterium]
MENSDIGTVKKNRIALTSVIAAVFLTSFKLVVGLLTGSLGIISEALHSGLDLIAAVITLFAVRIADLPADNEHNYGHGKVENLSAMIETFLLFVTCFWIIYESISRLISRRPIEINAFSYIVIITSIIIDFSRSRALYSVARKYNSQALEADALHFSTDIWSSLVVLIGLIAYNSFHLIYADSIAALIVAMIVLSVSYRLGRRAFDVLIDRAPTKIVDQINLVIEKIPGVKKYHDLRVRE